MEQRQPTRSNRYYPIKLACRVEKCDATNIKECLDCNYLMFQRLEYSRRVL